MDTTNNWSHSNYFQSASYTMRCYWTWHIWKTAICIHSRQLNRISLIICELRNLWLKQFQQFIILISIWGMSSVKPLWLILFIVLSLLPRKNQVYQFCVLWCISPHMKNVQCITMGMISLCIFIKIKKSSEI